MLPQHVEEAVAPAALNRFLPWLTILFVGSGCAALTYEVVWYQLLELVVGSSGVSLGVLLGTFMGGLCLGSLLLSRFVSRRWHPLRVYGLLELAIGVCGLLLLGAVPLASRVYAAIGGAGPAGILVRALIAAVCLLVPTMLMGATLPAIARWVESTPRGVAWLGFFYGGNTLGAVFGCLLAGFYLLRVHDMATATYVAVLINAAVALLSFGLAGIAPYKPGDDPEPEPERGRTAGTRAVFLVIGLSGMAALGAEVIWTRLLSLMLGATVYTFSIILAVFLIGIGIGSGIGSAVAGESKHPRVALGICQFLLAAATAWAAFVISGSLPYWPVNSALSSSPWYTFQVDLVRVMWAVLPASLLWGASFPLALAAVAVKGKDPGRLVGTVYAANTVGAILGALVFSLILVPGIGTHRSQRVLVAMAGVSALLALAGPLRRSARRLAPALAVAAVVVAVTLLALAVPGLPWQVVAYGRQMLTSVGSSSILEVSEGMNASIAITEWIDGKRLFHVSGKVEASSEPHDMRLQRMLGHLPAMMHPNPKTVLVVGFGAGVTAGSFVLYPGIEKIVICEIEPRIPEIATKYFSRENYEVLNDRRVQVVYDDARHYILTTKDKFDIITSDPIHPWVKGSATLYSREYFEMCRRRLNPGGLISQWLPLYESNTETVKTELATFFQVFPNGTLWGNDVSGAGYDSVLIGQAGNGPIDVDGVQRRLDSREYERAAISMSEVGFNSAADLLGTYAAHAPDLRDWLKGAAINHDGDLRLQYLAGMGLNLQRAVTIYNDILQFRRYPESVFAGSGPSAAALRGMLGDMP